MSHGLEAVRLLERWDGTMDAPATLPPPSPAACPPTPPVRLSIYKESKTEADKFKWIASERAGRDLGEWAIRQWVLDHWWGYLRARWLEHLQGKCFWIELDRGDYGFLQRDFQDQKALLETILDQLKRGQENLDIINWAVCNHLEVESVIDILTALDINSRRLVHKFDCEENTLTDPEAPSSGRYTARTGP
jgi:hypothetical protein